MLNESIKNQTGSSNNLQPSNLPNNPQQQPINNNNNNGQN